MTKQTLQTLTKSLPKNAAQSEKKLLELFVENMTDDDASLFHGDLGKTMINTQWHLTKTRKTNTAAIQIQHIKPQGKNPGKTIIDIVCNDMAFLIDSVVAKINTNKLLIDLLLHPIVGVKFDEKNNLQDIQSKSAKGYKRESHMHIHIKQTLSNAEMKELEQELHDTIKDVIITNRDWRPMQAELKAAIEELKNSNSKTPKKQIEQYCAFLDYLYNNNFTLLGYREYSFVQNSNKLTSKTIKDSGLGLLHDNIHPVFINDHAESLPHNLQNLRRNLPAVYVSKTNQTATVHRRVPMDTIAIKIFDDKGNVVGEKLFLGLFTSVTYSRSVMDVPYLREKVEEVMALSDFLDGSHNRKALRHTLEKYPRDELFQIPAKELFKICLNILRLQERQRISLFTREDPFGRYISCLTFIPRDRFGTNLRQDIAAALEEELQGTCTSFTVSLDDSLFARVMFMIMIKGRRPPPYKTAEIEKKLQNIGKTWPERLSEALGNADLSNQSQNAIDLTADYGEAFPISYTSRYNAQNAIFDIQKIESAYAQNRLTLELYQLDSLEDNQLRLKVYSPNTPLNLSDVMPIIQNMGLRAISELPFEIAPANKDNKLWIHDFLLEIPQTNKAIDLKSVKDNFEEAFTQIWYRDIENDALNKLVIGAAIPWRDVTILRTYVRYLKQINYPFGQDYIHTALNAHPKIAKSLTDYFYALFNPKNKKLDDKTTKNHNAELKSLLEKVDSLDQDRILRTISKLITASLRTNFFQTTKDGNHKPCLSIKLDSKAVPGMPEPKPFREIFVYSPRVEAIHLRGDEIARGGLRWSDRHEDFRTEVLGLMKAQMVKNSVIVPVGAKGGFVVKTKTNSRDEFMKEGIECYKIFIRGLLDITDNLDGQKVIPPKNVVRRDSDDPYLVVAADKGTATFSDTANAISIEYGHWLGDAFASGGSAGYDHKKMGITARGAWESVKLHFRQLNHNTQTEAFDVVGIGDMGGDVFGNGMLLSKHIRLIGAFNHLHILCDPDPDTASTFKERERLFKAVKGWDAYNTDLLSKGGRIFSRADKTLKLTPEIQKRFDIESNQVTPGELMNAMLKARTDLLWFGGIGTYIKSESESNSDAGDKANDAIRINGNEVRAKVLGEGANLGITQLGRIEFAKNGGKLNTDFIDNSGGVDSSDHEVNIKILMADVMRNNKNMDTKERNKLLKKMTNDVAFHVLRNNYQQALAVSMSEFNAPERLQLQSELIKTLEREEGLNRAIEYLPTNEEIEERQKEGKGLTRPELSVLISYAKIKLTKEFLNSDMPDQDNVQIWANDYFPKDLRADYKKEIANHKLRREIISMKMAGSIVNRMGPTFIKDQRKRTDKDYTDIAKAYTIVRDIFDLRPLWDDIEALDNKVLAQIQLQAMKDITETTGDTVTWFLTYGEKFIKTNGAIENFKPHIQTLSKKIPSLVKNGLKSNIDQKLKSMLDNGFSEKTSKAIAYMPIMAFIPDIINIMLNHKTDLTETAKTYFEIGDIFHLDWLRSKAKFLKSDNPREIEAMNGMIYELNMIQNALTTHILTKKNLKSKPGTTKVKQWLEANQESVENIQHMFSDLKQFGKIELADMILVEQQLRRLYGS